MISDLKKLFKKTIFEKLNILVDIQDSKMEESDLAIPLFRLSKELEKPILDVYNIIFDIIKNNKYIKHITFEKGFLNILLNRNIIAKIVLNDIYNKKDKYEDIPSNNQQIFIDYSSPNIAKHFSIGHLRSTIIGNCIKLIYRKRGYSVYSENYLGDWGSQFGKLVVAYLRWGNDEEIKKNPVSVLQALYVRYHNEEELDDTLIKQAHEVFNEMEKGNEKYLKIWRYFRDVTIEEFDKMYSLLNVSFDSQKGEAYYNSKVDAVLDLINKKNILKIDQGASIINVGDDIPPALIKRADGAPLYLLRDIATIYDRYKQTKFNKILYVVGNEQTLHFQQLKRVCKLLDLNFDIEHVNFGLVLLDGKKMSTRQGHTAKLIDILNNAISDSKNAILDKNPNLENIDDASKKIGVGAVIYNDLKNEKHLNIDFNLENMLKFEGQTGPYIQYTSVRINSIINQVNLNISEVDYNIYNDSNYYELVKLIDQFGEVLDKVLQTYSPAGLARYLFNLSQAFNKLYSLKKFIVDDINLLASNMLILSSVRIVINEGLRLLGIDYLDKM